MSVLAAEYAAYRANSGVNFGVCGWPSLLGRRTSTGRTKRHRSTQERRCPRPQLYGNPILNKSKHICLQERRPDSARLAKASARSLGPLAPVCTGFFALSVAGMQVRYVARQLVLFPLNILVVQGMSCVDAGPEGLRTPSRHAWSPLCSCPTGHHQCTPCTVNVYSAFIRNRELRGRCLSVCQGVACRLWSYYEPRYGTCLARITAGRLPCHPSVYPRAELLWHTLGMPG